MTAIRITGGQVHDPANAVDGEVRDVCLEDGKVVADVGPDARRIDARGMVVMPGGVDIHAHIAGPKVNAARKLTPEERRDDPLDRTELLRSGTGGLVPSTFATGYRYSLLGYTTVVEAAAPPLAARHVLSELRDTPMIDKAFLILMGNNQVLFELIRESGGAVSAAAARRRRVVAGGDGRLRGEARQSRRRGGLEAGQRQRPLARRRGRGLRRDPAPGAGGDRRGGGRARAAPSRPHPRQQPRGAGQRRHDARDDAHAVRTPGALRPPAVPLLRRPSPGVSLAPGRPSCSTTWPRIPRSPPTSAR